MHFVKMTDEQILSMTDVEYLEHLKVAFHEYQMSDFRAIKRTEKSYDLMNYIENITTIRDEQRLQKYTEYILNYPTATTN